MFQSVSIYRASSHARGCHFSLGRSVLGSSPPPPFSIVHNRNLSRCSYVCMRTSTVYVLPANSQCQGDCCIHTRYFVEVGLLYHRSPAPSIRHAFLSKKPHAGCVAVTSFVQMDPIKPPVVPCLHPNPPLRWLTSPAFWTKCWRGSR